MIVSILQARTSRPDSRHSRSHPPAILTMFSSSCRRRSADDLTWRPINSVFTRSNRFALRRVGFAGNENTTHWALFIPDWTGGVRGKTCHVSVVRNKYKKVVAHLLLLTPTALRETSISSSFQIEGAVVGEWQLWQAAHNVYLSKGYNMVTNNCQHFCVDVVTELHRLFPHCVKAEAIDLVQSRGTIFTRGRDLWRRLREKTSARPGRPISGASHGSIG